MPLPVMRLGEFKKEQLRGAGGAPGHSERTAKHVARNARNIKRLAAAVPLDKRDEVGDEISVKRGGVPQQLLLGWCIQQRPSSVAITRCNIPHLIAQAANAQASLKPEPNLRHHVRHLLLS
jgi:diketogulonate reductase-like aldo/keto reductase